MVTFLIVIVWTFAPFEGPKFTAAQAPSAEACAAILPRLKAEAAADPTISQIEVRCITVERTTGI